MKSYLSSTRVTSPIHVTKKIRIAMLALVGAGLLASCSSKLEDEYDFRPYIASWSMDNCGAKKKYNCTFATDGFADGFYVDDDYVYGIPYTTAEGKKRVVYVKVEARKPYTRTVIDDKELPEEKKD